jgi:predicted ATPase with chaperone activity
MVTVTGEASGGAYGNSDAVGLAFRHYHWLVAKKGRIRCRRSAHNVLLLGPPGTGTSMLARRLTTILPTRTLAEAIETTRIHRVAGLTGARTGRVTTRPCRAPHHTISDAGLIVGGHVPMPGEVSLAHNGVLFLDEWPEFHRHVLEVVRQPLEKSVPRISSPARSECPCCRGVRCTTYDKPLGHPTVPAPQPLTS